MRGIVQYEVYVLDEGRWTLCARYPGAQREDAVNDASSTEAATGRPTKVVRDTYYPETNQNEEITTYISPKGRALQKVMSAHRRAATAAILRKDSHRAVRRAPSAQPRQSARPRRLTRAEVMTRIIVAAVSSIVLATLATLMVSSFLTHIARITTLISADMISTLITATYVIIFLATFPRVYRSRWRLHQVLLEMWQSTEKAVTAPAPPPQRPTKVRRRRLKESFRPWDLMRFDTPPPPPSLDVPTGATVTVQAAATPPQPAAPPPAQEVNTPKAEPAKQAKDKAADKAANDKAANDKAATPEQAPAATPLNAENLLMERIVLRRFALDVIKPLIARSYRDDPVTRRGIALILAGAVQGFVDASRVGTAGFAALLSEALTQAGTKPASIESFVASYSDNIAAPNAPPLLTAGQVAIKNYAEGRSGIEQDLMNALAAWRFPKLAQAPETRVSVYMYTDVREYAADPDDAREQASLHDTVARATVMERGGQLIPHDGTGVFSRFDDEATAIAAADAIRQGLNAASGPTMAAAVIKRTHGLLEADNATDAFMQARVRWMQAPIDQTLTDTPPSVPPESVDTEPPFASEPKGTTGPTP
jgi:adenylate cyclase